MKTISKIKVSDKPIKPSDSFAVNPEYVQERTGDYEARDYIKSKWEYSTGKWLPNSSGNVNGEFVFDTKKQEWVFLTYQEQDKFHEDSKQITMYHFMSAPLLLYRLIATFFGAPHCFDGYKNIWSYTIKHIPSGKEVTFAEWKGAIGFWLPEQSYTELKPEFRDDFIELFTYICSDKCAHPYGSLCAGSVA